MHTRSYKKRLWCFPLLFHMKGEYGNTRLHFTGGAGETLKTPHAFIFGVSIWQLFKYGNLEIFQPVQPSGRINMLFTLMYLLLECKMFSFQEETVLLTLALSDASYQPAERHRNKTCIISWIRIAPPFGAVFTIPAFQGCLLLPSANSALVLSCMQRHYWIALSEGKNFWGFFLQKKWVLPMHPRK